MHGLSRMHMKWKHGALALVLVLIGANAAAQDANGDWDPRSGDAWVDAWLGDMNHYGARYPEPFIDEMVRYHNAPRPLVVELLQTRHWAPGDVYYACAMASVLGRPCRYVADQYEADRGQGWGVLAQRLGIKPGSPEFHALKKGFVPTYDRWARPIDIDDDLRREYPEHSRNHSGKPAGHGGVPSAHGHGKPVKSGQAARGKGKAGNADAGKPDGKTSGQGSKKGKGNGKQ